VASVPEITAPPAPWNGRELLVPFARTYTRQNHAFLVLGPLCAPELVKT